MRSGLSFGQYRDETKLTDLTLSSSSFSWREAIAWSRQQGITEFLAVGGGSVIDTAKAANLFTVEKDADLFDYINAPVGKGLPVRSTLRPLIAIPTTAGTGSETTGSAIVDIPSLRFKTGIASRALKPMLGIVDPRNTETCPRNVHLSSGLDTLFHALESYTALPYNERVPRPKNPIERPAYQVRLPSFAGCSPESRARLTSHLMLTCVGPQSHQRRLLDLGAQDSHQLPPPGPARPDRRPLARTDAPRLDICRDRVRQCRRAPLARSLLPLLKPEQEWTKVQAEGVRGGDAVDPPWYFGRAQWTGRLPVYGSFVPRPCASSVPSLPLALKALTDPAFLSAHHNAGHREILRVFGADGDSLSVDDGSLGLKMRETLIGFLEGLGEMPRGLEAVGYKESDVDSLVEGVLVRLFSFLHPTTFTPLKLTTLSALDCSAPEARAEPCA